jgi:hypothetical protein
MAPPRGPLSPAPPRAVQGRYVVIPHSIHCRYETHWNFLGSDEIIVVFHDPISNSAVRTATFGNFDNGDTRFFAQANGCITPLGGFLSGENGQPVAWTCRQEGVASVSFVAEAYEDDDDGDLGTIPSYYSVGDAVCTDAQAPANCRDDFIGRAVVSYDAEQLDRWMPDVGAMREITVRLGGYDLTYRIQRVSNVAIDPAREIMR